MDGWKGGWRVAGEKLGIHAGAQAGSNGVAQRSLSGMAEDGARGNLPMVKPEL